MHGADDDGWRIPAKAMEDAVIWPLLDVPRSQSRTMDAMCLKNSSIALLTKLKAQATLISHQLEEGKPDEKRSILHAAIQHISIATNTITLMLDKPGLARILDIRYSMFG